MATVTITSVASGRSCPDATVNVAGPAPGWLVADIYQVAIELNSLEIADASRGPVTSDSYYYPPYSFARPKNRSRVQLSDGPLTRRGFTASPGKALFTATFDMFAGYTPVDALEAITLNSTFYDGTGAYSYDTIQAPEIIGVSDVGAFIGGVGKFLGAGTSTAYGGSWDVPKYGVYLFYLNIPDLEKDLGTNITIGINDASLNAVFGSNCIGVQISSYSGGTYAVIPTYKQIGDIVINGSTRPSFLRPKTFFPAGINQQDWRHVPCSSGTVPSQSFRSPCGECVFADMHFNNGFRWCALGNTESVVFYEASIGSAPNYVVRAFYVNAVGKIINTSGTVVTGTTYPYINFPGGRGTAPGWMLITISPPSGSVAYRLTYENTVVSPGVQNVIPGGLLSNHFYRPSHYSADYGAYIPGNAMLTTISESDMP